MKIIFIVIFIFYAFCASAQDVDSARKKRIWIPQNKFDTVLIQSWVDGKKHQKLYEVLQLNIHKADSLFGYTQRWLHCDPKVFLTAKKKKVERQLSDKIDPDSRIK